MLAFEISVNGKRLCVAGTAVSDVISTVVSWVRSRSNMPEQLDFHVGGILAGESPTHFGWTTPLIGPGDEITIRLVDTDSWDEPEHLYEPASVPERGNTG